MPCKRNLNMIWLAIFLLLVAVFASRAAKHSEVKTESTIVMVVCLTLGLFIAFCSSITYVEAGSIGVQVTYGTVNKRPINNGVQLVNPFCEVISMSTRTENYWMSHAAHESGKVGGDDAVSVRSSNGLQMPVDISVPYRLIPDSAPWVYENLGSNYVEKLIRPALSTATRRAASHYTAEELYSTKRDDFSEKIHILMDEELNKLLAENYKGKNPPEAAVVVSQVLIGQIGIPEMVKTAIENKLKADQEQQAMEFTILKAEKEAKRKEIEAGGIQKFQEIVSKGIDDHLLKWKAIEATLLLAESPNSKVIIIGGGKDGLPVILGSDGDAHVQTKPVK